MNFAMENVNAATASTAAVVTSIAALTVGAMVSAATRKNKRKHLETGENNDDNDNDDDDDDVPPLASSSSSSSFGQTSRREREEKQHLNSHGRAHRSSKRARTLHADDDDDDPVTISRHQGEKYDPEQTKESMDSNIVHLLKRRAMETPDHVVYMFLDDNGNESVTMTFRDVDRMARKVAATLQSDTGNQNIQHVGSIIIIISVLLVNEVAIARDT